MLLSCALLCAAVAFLASRAAMDVTVQGSATIRPAHRYGVRSPVTSIIHLVHVREGDRVQEGDLLIELDSSDLEAKLRTVDGELEINGSRRREVLLAFEQEQRLANADRERLIVDRRHLLLQLARVEAEYAVHLARNDRPASDLAGLTPVRLAALRLEQTDAALRNAVARLVDREDHRQQLATFDHIHDKLVSERLFLHNQLPKYRITSPAFGTISTPDLHRLEGTHVSAGGTVAEIIVSDEWVAEALVAETDIARIKTGQTVRLFLDAFPHMRYHVFEGIVTDIPVLPESSPSPLAVYPIRISIPSSHVADDDQSLSLVTGMKGEARIVIERGPVLQIAWRSFLKSIGRAIPLDVHL